MTSPKTETPEPFVDLRHIRELMGLTQAELAAMLGFSLRAIQSVEQGWRKPSAAMERAALLLLLAERHGADFSKHHCWQVQNCPPERRRQCIAYRSRQGHLCWFLTGTLCAGQKLDCWEDKRTVCAGCSFFKTLLEKADSSDSPTLIG